MTAINVMVLRARVAFWLWGRTISYSDPGFLELWSAYVAVYWGAILLMPFQTFPAPYSTGFYRVMAQAMEEEHWGALALIVGIAQFCGLGFKSVGAAWMANSVAAGLWAVIAFAIWTAAPYTASPGIHGMLAASMIYATWYRVRHGYGD